MLHDAQILVLDQPTSTMDAKAEYNLSQMLHDLAMGRMPIVIRHRLSAVRKVGHSYVIEHGRISQVASGMRACLRPKTSTITIGEGYGI